MHMYTTSSIDFLFFCSDFKTTLFIFLTTAANALKHFKTAVTIWVPDEKDGFLLGRIRLYLNRLNWLIVWCKKRKEKTFLEHQTQFFFVENMLFLCRTNRFDCYLRIFWPFLFVKYNLFLMKLSKLSYAVCVMRIRRILTLLICSQFLT